MNYSYKGKVLISTPDISGDIFSRSVVLIIDHNENGAFGLILNKKSPQRSKIPMMNPENEVVVYEGGPVEREKSFFIVKGESFGAEVLPISDEFYLTEDVHSLMESISVGSLSIHDFKMFSGYSGWAAQQLESEIFRKLWTVVDVYNLDYTTPNDHNLWKNIMQNLGGEYLIWANTPEDVSLN